MRDFRVAAGLIAAGVWASVAGAQDSRLRLIEHCITIRDNAARLQCFDQAASSIRSETPTSAKPEAQASAKPEAPDLFNLGAIFRNTGRSADINEAGWQIEADRSPLDDASQISGTLKSTDGTATLILRCKDKNTEAHLSMTSFLGWEGVRVLYRINDNQAAESRWAPSGDGKGGFVSAGGAIAFINSLTDGGTLLIRMFDHEGTGHDTKFGLQAVSNLRSQIAFVCRPPTVVPDEIAVIPQEPKRKPKVPATPAGPPKPAGPLKLY
jgi:hypothetical protein